jgi:Uma2 family endonuclease
MQEWIDQGARLGWLIDPEGRIVSIFRPGLPAEILHNPSNIAGEAPVQGFVLALDDIWAGL